MEQENKQENRFEETMIEGRNAVLEAFRSGKTVDKLFVLDGCQAHRFRNLGTVDKVLFRQELSILRRKNNRVCRFLAESVDTA